MSERIVQQPLAAERQSKFSDLPTADVERSTFDMSHSWKGTMEAEKIVPILLQEILPGDTFNIKTTAFMRLATPLKPIMDGLTADIHYFFVPNRLVWDNWQFFMGERKNPDDDPTTVTIPQIEVDLSVNSATGLLTDYMGCPLVTEAEGDGKTFINALPIRGYNLIYNEWYRNQNLIPEVDVPMDNGPDDGLPTIFGAISCKNRIKRADYFTRALPWPQKGDPVFLPLGEYAPITGIGTNNGRFTAQDVTVNESKAGTGEPDDGNNFYPWAVEVGGDNSGVFIRRANNDADNPAIYADLTQATAATINDIRTAFQVQRLLERDARGGTRYIEIILSHFNVQSPDARLQRPEYIGGGSARIIINPVAATVATEDAPQANLAAVGTGLVKARMNHSFTEHGYLYALTSCRADLTYQNGLDRIWSRKTRYDFYWPALSHLGEQQILNKEIFLGLDADDDKTWGYQERYAEYRYQPSRITGLFRSNNPQSLDVWHLAQDFDELPPLNGFFVVEDAPIDRVVAVPSEPDLLVDVWHEVKATRAMPVYAVPGMVDHF